jgi:hypothetical protein
MKRALPIVYDNARYAYQLECLREAAAQGVMPPQEAWQFWEIESATFRLHALRDPVELAAGLKWPVDFLVKHGFVADDSPRHLWTPVKWPSQIVSRQDRGLDLIIKKKAKHP